VARLGGDDWDRLDRRRAGSDDADIETGEVDFFYRMRR
jgi:hypothetical protein